MALDELQDSARAEEARGEVPNLAVLAAAFPLLVAIVWLLFPFPTNSYLIIKNAYASPITYYKLLHKQVD